MSSKGTDVQGMNGREHIEHGPGQNHREAQRFDHLTSFGFGF